LQLVGLEWGLGPSESLNADTMSVGLIMSKGRERKEIWVDRSLEPDSFFKNLVRKTTPKAGMWNCGVKAQRAVAQTDIGHFPKDAGIHSILTC